MKTNLPKPKVVATRPENVGGVPYRRGDLAVATVPDGTIRLCERIGERLAGWGDVTFDFRDQSGVIVREIRTKAMEELIGKPFRSVKGLATKLRPLFPSGWWEHSVRVRDARRAAPVPNPR